MQEALERLLKTAWARSSEWRSAAHPAWIEADAEASQPFPEAFCALLGEVNGLEAPDGAFRIFGVGPELPRYLRAGERNRRDGWMRHYGTLREGLFFFAEDAFGNQLAYELEGTGCVHFDGETGLRTPLAEGPFGWLEPVMDDPSRWLQLGSFEGYMEAGGDLGSGEMIAYKQALCLGGAPLFDNMVPRRIEVGLCLYGQIAQALAELPDGTPIDGIEWLAGSQTPGQP